MEETSQTRMPLWRHLEELRGALFRSVLVLMAGVVLCYCYSDRIVLFLERPLLRLLPEGKAHLYFTGITDKFFVYLKVSVLAGTVLVSPYLLYELWKFVRPALYETEKRFAFPFLFCGTSAFALGVSFGYFVVIPYGYKFLIEFGSPTDQALITLTEYFSLTLKLLFGVGLVFELPVLIVLLSKLGIVEAQTLVRYRRHAFLILAILSAIITPSPDAFTMVLMLIPLLLLYEISILGARWVGRRTMPAEGP
jgi:sec-independent protein translocase protein TatC